MKRGFTLIELIVVIIIVGILAAVGISQYSKTVEKMRGTELKATIGAIRKLAYNYWLENGTITGITNNDVGIGTGQIPVSCTSTHYFHYHVDSSSSAPALIMYAVRCTSGGKTPQGTDVGTCETGLTENFSTGSQTWYKTVSCSARYY